MTALTDSWWVINGDALRDALERVHDGDDPGVVYAELYANSTTEGERAAAADREPSAVVLRERVAALHRPEPVYWDAFQCPVPDEHAEHHVEGRYTNDDICTACPPVHQTCAICVEYGEHGPEALRWPCPTARLLAEDAAGDGGGS